MINKKRLDENEIKEFILEQSETDPLVKKMVNNVLKKRWIEEEMLSNKDLVEEYVSVIMLMSFVSDMEVKQYIKYPEYKEIYKKVENSFLSNTIDPDLIKLYKRNLSPVIKKINYFIRKYEKKLYGKRYSEIQRLKKSDRSDKDEIIQNIKEKYLSNPLYNEIRILEFEKERLQKFPYSIKDTKDSITVSGDSSFLQKYCSLKIFQPELFTTIFQYEKKYEKFPLKWLTHLTIPQYRRLYEEFKKGSLRENVLLDEVNSDGFFNDFFEKSQHLNFFRERKRFIEQIIENHRTGRYASAINLIFPLMESFLWVFAAYVHKHKKKKIFKALRLKNFWSFNKRSYKKLILVPTIGKEMEDPKIRDLISRTHLKNYLPEELVEYYAEEFFEERNPILHGNSIDYDTEVNSAKKIICLNNLIGIFIEEITNIDLPPIKKEKINKINNGDSELYKGQTKIIDP